jgi:hypothetical protein
MDRPVYPIAEIEPLVFRFDSIGPKGIIPKLIVYQPMGAENEFNLALLDITQTGLSDFSISANGDMEKVIASVIATFDLFFRHHPDARVVFSGSSPSRIRLYCIIISKYEEIATETFHLYGIRQGNYERFKKDIAYESFIIEKRYE